MTLPTSRRKFLLLLLTAFVSRVTRALAQIGIPGPRRRGAEPYVLPPDLAAFAQVSVVLGRVSDRAVTASVLALDTVEGRFLYGTSPGQYTHKTDIRKFPAGAPVPTVFSGLKPSTQYYYRLDTRKPGDAAFTARPEGRWHTQRAAGSTFTFALQGDSHPERPQMSDPALYARTLASAAAGSPDFYLCMGDDFSVAPVQEVSAAAIGARYTLQRPFLGLVAQSAPLFLLNGNHEQASLFNFNQTDERRDVAILAQNARNRYFPTPGPDGFYSGDSASLRAIGLLKDYYAWTWGDALFVVLDNYWQAPVQVDSGYHKEEPGGGGGGAPPHLNQDWWGLTLGDAQYHWFQRTLEQSKAKYKFVFAHHVHGSGRGGVDQSALYEWGGCNKRGDWLFPKKRPGWEMPVHHLMVKHGVTIFFQGHDHLYARQERDGVIYQTVPMPADPGYVARNQDCYAGGVILPNSGHLRVTVSPEKVTVDYLRSYLPADETEAQKTGDIAHSYTIPQQAFIERSNSKTQPRRT